MQAKKEVFQTLSDEEMRIIHHRYALLQKELVGLPWIVQGTVVEIPPKSATSKTTYIWTRKVSAKTITVSLSPDQATAFRAAIAANRRVEKALREMRELSRSVLVNTLPQARKRSAPRVRTQGKESSLTRLI